MTAIQAYFHCKACHAEGRPSGELEVGLSNPQTITIDCTTCNQHVGSFKLANPIPDAVCHDCGEPIGHKH